MHILMRLSVVEEDVRWMILGRIDRDFIIFQMSSLHEMKLRGALHDNRIVFPLFASREQSISSSLQNSHRYNSHFIVIADHSHPKSMVSFKQYSITYPFASESTWTVLSTHIQTRPTPHLPNQASPKPYHHSPASPTAPDQKPRPPPKASDPTALSPARHRAKQELVASCLH